MVHKKERSKKKGISTVLKDQVSLIRPDESELAQLKEITKKFQEILSKEISNSGFDAEVFIGGSFAKGTMIRKEKYDVDIFVRFDWRYDDLSDPLEKILQKISKKTGYNVERLHGSRDYFRVHLSEHTYFEIIPVTKIKKPHEERNVTDLSYFHVPYVRKKIKGIEDELRLAKTFFHAHEVYGAESYIQGFSGYALECLIIHYKSFEKMLRELSKVKDRIVIDIEKHYKKNQVFFEMNENKLHSPIVLIDPTYKERNALASLGRETFEKFQKVASEFLKNPSKEHFIVKGVNVDKIKRDATKKKAKFLHVNIKTDKQEGDIAGTKLKKFHYVLESELGKYFDLLHHEFHYDGKQNADVYFILKSKKEIVRIGPPLKMKDYVKVFKSEHLDTFEKKDRIYAKIKVKFGAKEYLDAWARGNEKLMNEMHVIEIKASE